MNHEELRQLMEGYRAGDSSADDAELAALEQAARQDPALRAQWEAIQSWDGAIGQAMHDVPVPAGLAERILQSLQQADEVNGPDEVAAPAEDEVLVTLPIDRPWWNRWSVRLAVASAAAALILVVGLARFGDSLTAQDVAAQVPAWLKEVEQTAWQQTPAPQEAQDCIKSGALRNIPGTNWQRLDTDYDRQAVIIQTTLPQGQTRAWLIVIKTWRGRQLDTRPPLVPQSTTGARRVGVWKHEGQLCVLVVQGSQQNYRSIVPSSAIAWLGPVGKEKEERSRSWE